MITVLKKAHGNDLVVVFSVVANYSRSKYT